MTILAPESVNDPQNITVSFYVHSNAAAKFYVPSDFLTIQSAIDMSLDGDTIIVSEGIYSGTGNRDINFKGKKITVRSEYPDCPEVVAATIIDCGGTEAEHHSGFLFHSEEDANSVINGLTIKNGYAVDGAGISCSSSPTIRNCNIIDCSAASRGGGIKCYGSSPIISGCNFTGNTAHTGGAINTIYKGSPVIENCRISGNTASGVGGGINCDMSSSPVISNCLIINNQAGNHGGGGISIYRSDAHITNCTIANNTSSNGGSGITHQHNYEGVSILENCIVWGNTPSSGQITLSLNAEMTVNYCDVEGGLAGASVYDSMINWGTRNYDMDPLFTMGLSGDYYLSQVAAGQTIDSICINTGSELAVTLGMDSYTTHTGQVGDAAFVDIGYHYRSVNTADLNGDGLVNIIDLGIVALQWGLAPSLPSADISPFEGDGTVDFNDLNEICKNWLWQND